MNSSPIPASEILPHFPSPEIPSLPLVFYIPTVLSLVVSAVVSFCYSRTKTPKIPGADQRRIVQCCAWTTEAMQWIILLSCAVNMHLATPVKSIHDEPAKSIIGIGVMWTFLLRLHWLALEMIDWIDGWMNGEGDSIADGLQPFMLTRAAATKAWSIASPPERELPIQTNPPFPPSSRPQDLHLQLPCNVDLKPSTLSSAQSERRSSRCSISSETSMEPQSSTTPAVCTSRLRRHSEPTSSLTPLKQFFNLDYSLPPFALEEINAANTDTVLSTAAATPNCNSIDLSPAISIRTSWVKACVEQFEAL